ncbi:SDA1 domain containing protein Mys45A [Arctopsyche grandis]|uniref:SDA1 domain containing protein Mys45A n=1 Tax=Arctopsyche grandis TaxID=121162 RepID=UPI00406DA1BC
MVRHNNQLPDNLPQLQNLLKREPDTYREEFIQQYRHFESTLEVFRLSPSQQCQALQEQVNFLAQVAHCFAEELRLLPQQLADLLDSHNSILDPEMRMAFCKALILLRNKNLLPPYDLLQLFFRLLKCQDNALRDFLETHIITDIKNINAKHKDVKLNSTLQNFMYTMLKDSNPKAAKMSVDIMIELYNKNVWNDSKTVNVIASTGCFSKFTKVMVASLKFFLGKDPEEKDSDSDSGDEPNARESAIANKFNKKTRKRGKQLEKVKKLATKSKKKKSKAPIFSFSALHLVNNPQGFAERLFRQLESSNGRFEVKLMTLDVISRLIGLHDLFLFNFYPFITKLIQPHQREVTRILQFAAQASHELVPPDVIEPVIKGLVNNFITERNSSDVMAIGLNAVREICARCPLSMNEDLLRDLAQYKNYKDKSVMMASKSLIVLYRNSQPELLHKRDRGRPTEATAELRNKKYGEVDTKDYIPGSEVLLQDAPQKEKVEENSDDSSDEGSWIDVNESGSEINIDSDSEDSDDESAQVKKGKNQKKRKILKAKKPTEKVKETTVDAQDKVEVAQKMSLERIFTDEDFKRIDKENIKKQMRVAKAMKRKFSEIDQPNTSELVQLGDIENIYKKRKHDKKARIESIKAGRAGRDKFGYKDGRQNVNCSKTNREKKKTKNYQMIIHKAKGKIKRSFKDKQRAFKNYLVKQKKMR